MAAGVQKHRYELKKNKIHRKKKKKLADDTDLQGMAFNEIDELYGNRKVCFIVRVRTFLSSDKRLIECVLKCITINL